MSDFELNKWKQKTQQLTQQLEEKEQIIEEYKKTIEQSNQSIKEIMDKLSLELKMANQMHRILLPVDLPVISGCEFSFKFRAGEVDNHGKDFYEVVPHPRRRCFSITLSSCTSHSLSALLFSARLKAMSWSETQAACQPHEFISCLSAEIQKDIKTSSFKGLMMDKNLSNNIDLFYAVVDQRSYQTSYCLIGKVAVFVQRTGHKKSVQEITVDSDRTQLKSHAISLNNKDRLILCSPGILSCLDPSGQQFTASYLKQIIEMEFDSSVHELRNRILYELDKFCQGRPKGRDQSVLVMSVKHTALKLT